MENESPVEEFYKWLEAELLDLEQNGPKVRRGRKPSKKQYFTYMNEKAIVAYNKETNQALKDLEKSSDKRGDDLEGMYNETTEQLREEDQNIGQPIQKKL